ncbi:hypothetical protein SEA_LOZINAK_131 [Gordonia phage Lozinak]|uniref:Uncharacterized protein n=4 Tax=Smoothievirus TaxID=1982557 RepID=A0A2D1GG62_9CAUD|nr:hypothetical protein BEN60_gp075 [Gordonia phage Smoothie]YP_009273166.1 hypothetical protein BH768_gp076 [Gordonia phage ClubL]ATN90757.1 hypothetical protein SEA_LOZINAK_131 [Gordonia phage Lozinak]AUE23539.1 hypothetical protein SEA_TONIANN_131 [Gordonia phage Toniann]QAU06994.1 hypothetical protein SEA_APHELION_130 [Gordonia phage Aphelion]QYC53613.1 hypothetical protein SEA_NORVS_129 [Gordonia phage Norvs]WKW85929.1 hypothetical protein SEA_PHINKBODEN_130 [Gordonia Phage PhinkBoden]W
MIAAAVNRGQVGWKAKIGSLDGLIIDVAHKVRGGLSDTRTRRPIDIHLTLDTPKGIKHIVVSPRTEIQILPSIMPNQWRE